MRLELDHAYALEKSSALRAIKYVISLSSLSFRPTIMFSNSKVHMDFRLLSFTPTAESSPLPAPVCLLVAFYVSVFGLGYFGPTDYLNCEKKSHVFLGAKIVFPSFCEGLWSPLCTTHSTG